MRITSKFHRKIALPAICVSCASFAIVAAQAASAQSSQRADIIVTGAQPELDPASMAEGPKVEGIISARRGNEVQVTAEDGSRSVFVVTDATQISSAGGFLGLGRKSLPATSLLNGLPVTVNTLQGGGTLLASKVKLRGKDLRTANMIRNGTEQGFAEQTAATNALRGRVGDIDQYNIKGTTNVNFATGKYNLTPQGKADLCATADTANSMKNAMLLVVGYTDSVGSEEYNQILSEKRAGRVVNYLQQKCGWKPYRMLTPTGMSEADPLADNNTAQGKAQNRRVAVNILVSKGLDGL